VAQVCRGGLNWHWRIVLMRDSSKPLWWLRQGGAALCLAIVFFISYNQRVRASEGFRSGIEYERKSGTASIVHDVHQLQFDVEIEEQASGEDILNSRRFQMRQWIASCQQIGFERLQPTPW
jgi:hypothetical protein